MSVESNHDLSAGELKAKKKEEKRKLKEAKREKDMALDVDDLVKDKSEKKLKKKSKKRSRDEDDKEEKQHDGLEKNNDAEEDAVTEKRSRKKRKSVSFADNVDVQTIEHKDAMNGSGKDTKSDDNEAKNTVDNEELSRERRKKEKREKREQRRKDGEKSTTTTEGEKHTAESADKSILAYLSQYHHDRASWKFQKIREAQLLKHVFSLEHVPSEYNPALLAYLKGLKSEGARTRLRKSAQDVIKFDEKHTTASLADDNTATEETRDIAKLPALPESWREEYGNAVWRFKGNLNAGVKDLNEGVTLTAPNGDDDADGKVDPNVLTRLEYRKRAEMVQWAVSGKIGKYSSATTSKQEKSVEVEAETEPTEDTSITKKKPNQKAPARKKRKNRTMIVEISSSSESSDSDSD